MNEPGPSKAGVLAFDTVTTLDDVVAAFAVTRAQGRVRKGPAPRHSIRNFVVWLAIFLVCFFVASHGAFDRWTTPSLLSVIAVDIAFVGFAIFGAARIQVWFGRRQLRRMLADVLRARPDVRRDDPTLAVTRHDRFDDDGYTRTTAADEQWESWARITELVETKDLFVLVVTETMGYAFPKRGMPATLQDEMRHFVQARLSAR